MSARADAVGIGRTHMARMIGRVGWKSENRQGKLASAATTPRRFAEPWCVARGPLPVGATFDCTVPVSASSIGDGGYLTVRILGFMVTSHQKGLRFIVWRGRHQ